MLNALDIRFSAKNDMKKNILVVYSTTSNAHINVLNVANINNENVDLRFCTFGKPSDENIQFNFDIKENDYSIPGWIAIVNSSIVSIFDKFIPDVIILTGYNLTSVGGAVAAYFMGIRIYLIEEEDLSIREIEYFPMKKGFELLISLVDYHYCVTRETYDILKGYKIINSKIMKTSDLDDIIFN